MEVKTIDKEDVGASQKGRFDREKRRKEQREETMEKQ